MKAYLRSAVALIKQFAWAFPAFKKPAGMANALDIDLQSLDPEELDAIIEFAFLRYFDDSGLFGTVDDALARVEQVKAIGVDEIACLIDFGVPSATAMEALDPLAKVVAAANGGEEAFESPGDFSIGGLIRSPQCNAFAVHAIDGSDAADGRGYPSGVEGRASSLRWR